MAYASKTRAASRISADSAAGMRIRPMALARMTGQALSRDERLLVTAESCTGGLIAEWLTRVPGSSAWFDGAMVTYSNAAKQQLLGVNNVTLERYGAVSEETASEMVIGALQNSVADIAVAVTGIAGPEGGTKAKPVGTVCFAWADRSGLVQSARVQLTGDRLQIRRQSAALALTGVLDWLSA